MLYICQFAWVKIRSSSNFLQMYLAISFLFLIARSFGEWVLFQAWVSNGATNLSRWWHISPQNGQMQLFWSGSNKKHFFLFSWKMKFWIPFLSMELPLEGLWERASFNTDTIEAQRFKELFSCVCYSLTRVPSKFSPTITSWQDIVRTMPSHHNMPPMQIPFLCLLIWHWYLLLQHQFSLKVQFSSINVDHTTVQFTAFSTHRDWSAVLMLLHPIVWFPYGKKLIPSYPVLSDSELEMATYQILKDTRRKSCTYLMPEVKSSLNVNLLIWDMDISDPNWEIRGFDSFCASIISEKTLPRKEYCQCAFWLLCLPSGCSFWWLFPVAFKFVQNPTTPASWKENILFAKSLATNKILAPLPQN